MCAAAKLSRERWVRVKPGSRLRRALPIKRIALATWPMSPSTVIWPTRPAALESLYSLTRLVAAVIAPSALALSAADASLREVRSVFTVVAAASIFCEPVAVGVICK